MKILILAAGYGTRLYPLTKDKPKPLLDIAGRPLLDYIIDRINQIKEVDLIYVVTNEKFSRIFENWSKKLHNLKPIKIINDGTLTNEDRLGSIGDIHFVLDQERLDDDLLVIGGDNLFEDGLKSFVNFAEKNNPGVTIGIYNLHNKSLASEYGVVEMGKNDKVTNFLEKPKNPPSALVSMCLYFFPAQSLHLFHEYKIDPKNKKDNAGDYIKWLLGKTKVFGFIFKNMWYDIGSRESYEEVNRSFLKKIQS